MNYAPYLSVTTQDRTVTSKLPLTENQERALDFGCDLSEFIDECPRHLIDDLVWAIVNQDQKAIQNNIDWIECDALEEWLIIKEEQWEERDER